MYQILIVDDEPMAIKACRHALPWADFGMDPTWAKLNPIEALDLLKTQMMDACFVDLRMPELSGFEFIQEARKIQPELLFIVLTGYDQYDFVREAFKENVFDYCLKPIQRSEAGSLLPRLESELQRIRIKRDAFDFTISREKIERSLRFRFDDTKNYYLVSIDIHDDLPSTSDRSFVRRLLLSMMGGYHWVKGPHLLHVALPAKRGDADGLQFESIIQLLTQMKERISLSFRILREPINLEQLSLIGKYLVSHVTLRSEDDVYLSLSKLLDLQDNRIERALLEIHQNYSRDLSLRKMANVLEMNYTYFSELFSKVTGRSFTQYLNEVRLSASKRLLTNTNLSISDIAYQVGYNSEQYFSRQFKKLYEISPSRYRKEVVSSET